MKIIKMIALTIYIISVIFTTGCWNYTDVESQFVAMGLATDIDPETDEYILYAEISKAKGAADAKLITRIGTAKGPTLFQANRNLISTIGAKVYWGHTMIYVVSERLAREGITDLVELLRSQTQVRSDIFVIVTDDDSIATIFDFEDPIHDDVSQHLHDLLEFYEAAGTYIRSPLFTVLSDIASDEISLLLPYVKMVDANDTEEEKEDGSKNEEEKDEESKDKESEDASASEEKPKEIIISDGCAVFGGDKFIGKLDDIETLYTMILRGDLNDHYVLTLSDHKILPNSSIEIIKSDMKINPTVSSDRLHVAIELELQADLVEMDTLTNYKDSKKKIELEIGFEEMIKNEINSVIKKTQDELGVDIFGITGYVHRQEHDYYKSHKENWRDVYANADFRVDVDVNIAGSSLTFMPLQVGE